MTPESIFQRTFYKLEARWTNKMKISVKNMFMMLRAKYIRNEKNSD